jgi:hypothetical protein
MWRRSLRDEPSTGVLAVEPGGRAMGTTMSPWGAWGRVRGGVRARLVAPEPPHSHGVFSQEQETRSKSRQTWALGEILMYNVASGCDSTNHA